jgi:hypothetical protein
MKVFDQEFAESLPNDAILGAKAIIDRYIEWNKDIPGRIDTLLPRFDEFLRAFVFYQSFVEKYGLECKFPKLNFADQWTAIGTIRDFFSLERGRILQLATKLTAERTFDEYKAEMGAIFRNAYVYDFSDGDVQRIQTLINELRDEITNSTVLTDQHKRRLHAKLEKLQSELHKTMSDLDRFWGLFVEAGLMLGKFGNSIKPLTDRVREIAEIVWHVQARAAGLPSNQPLTLPAPEQHDEAKS